MSNRILKRWVAVAALASLTLPPGLTQLTSGITDGLPTTDASQTIYGGNFGSSGLATDLKQAINLSQQQIQCICDAMNGQATTHVRQAIQNAPVTQNFIQLTQPEEPSTGDMNYASPTYSATDLQGDMGDSDVSEDSE